MTLILCHIGESLPDYFFDCVKQTRKFYDGKIVLITNSKNLNTLIKYNVEIYEPNFENQKVKITEKINFYHFPSREFWFFSLIRFFFIEEYVVKNKVQNFIVFENDVLIYYDLSEMCDKLSKTYENIAITFVDDVRATTGFSFFKSYDDLKQMNEDIISISQDVDGMKDILTNYAPNCPSEMVFIRKISKDKNYIKPLPLFPDDYNYDKLNFVFDPSSYGQYLGGTPKEYGAHQKTFLDDSTYIGRKLSNKEYIVSFSNEDGPTLINNDGKKIKIYNLHIHSKQLIDFSNS